MVSLCSPSFGLQILMEDTNILSGESDLTEIIRLGSNTAVASRPRYGHDVVETQMTTSQCVLQDDFGIKLCTC